MNQTQVDLLEGLLNRKQGSLNSIGEQFATQFKDAMSIFEAATYLVGQIMDQDLVDTQRLIALYLLLISYPKAGQSHPFICVLLEISQRTEEPLERIMIADLLLRSNREKYNNFEIGQLVTYVEKQPELLEEEQGIRSLRKVAEGKYKELQANFQVSKGSPGQEITSVQFLRPFPQFMKISNSQLHWLSPGIISDVEWDNTADIDRKLQRPRKLFNIALDRQLDTGQRSDLLIAIDSDPHTPLHIGLKPQLLNPLISNNPYIAAALLIKAAKYSIMQEYLEQLLKIPTEILLLDAMGRVVKQIRVPQAYMTVFCTHHMGNVIKAPGDIQQKRPLVLTMSAFVQCMIENGIVGFPEIKTQLKKFMDEFSQIVDFGSLKNLLDKIVH